MTREQFDRLCAAFWPTAKSPEIARRYAIYAEGTQDMPPHAVDFAIRRAVRECEKFPAVAKLREWAKEAIPKSTYRRLDSEQPCPNCPGVVRQSVKPDGTPWRMYVDHRPGCPNPTFAKPTDLAWRIEKPNEPIPRAPIRALIGAVADNLELLPTE